MGRPLKITIDPRFWESRAPRAPKKNEGSLSDAQVTRYNREGYLVVRDFLSPSELAPAREALEDKVSEVADKLFAAGLISDKRERDPFEKRLMNLFKNLAADDFLKFGRSWRDRHPGYFGIMSNPKLLSAVESLIGGEIFANPVYNSRPKVPGVAAGAVPWHQDKSYWPNANWNPVVTVWIPLVDTNKINGCLYVWPRTHRAKLVGWHKEKRSGTGYLEIDLKKQADRHAVALPVSAGSAIFFNDRCIHSSTPNRSDHVRWSVDLRYQPTEQDPMRDYGVGFLARSRKFPKRVARLNDWLAGQPERTPRPRNAPGATPIKAMSAPP